MGNQAIPRVAQLILPIANSANTETVAVSSNAVRLCYISISIIIISSSSSSTIIGDARQNVTYDIPELCGGFQWPVYWGQAGSDLRGIGGGFLASHEQRASYQTVLVLFLANDKCHPPSLLQHSGAKPRPKCTFSVSHSADGSLSLSFQSVAI